MVEIKGIILKIKIAPVYEITCFLRLSLAISKTRVYITASYPQSQYCAKYAVKSSMGSLYALLNFGLFTTSTAKRLNSNVVIILDLPAEKKFPLKQNAKAKCDITAKTVMR